MFLSISILGLLEACLINLRAISFDAVEFNSQVSFPGPELWNDSEQ